MFAPELVFTFVHACACTTPHLSEHMLHKYVLPLCKSLLRKVGPLDAGAIVPARVLNQAIACFAATLSNPIQAVFESERSRILRDVVEDRLWID